jgi:hypothetical protein
MNVIPLETIHLWQLGLENQRTSLKKEGFLTRDARVVKPNNYGRKKLEKGSGVLNVWLICLEVRRGAVIGMKKIQTPTQIISINRCSKELNS